MYTNIDSYGVFFKWGLGLGCEGCNHSTGQNSHTSASVNNGKTSLLIDVAVKSERVNVSAYFVAWPIDPNAHVISSVKNAFYGWKTKPKVRDRSTPRRLALRSPVHGAEVAHTLSTLLR